MNKAELFRLAVQLVAGTIEPNRFTLASSTTDTAKQIRVAYNAVKEAWQSIPDSGNAPVR